MKFKNKGFTLGEILVTLTIVGIVALLVVPSFMNDIQDKSRMSILVGTVGNINTSIQSYMVEHHLRDLSDFVVSDGESANTNDSFITDKFSIDGTFAPGVYKTLSKSTVNMGNTYTHTKALLSNGAGIALSHSAGNTVNKSSYYEIFIDVNGPKPPNTIGIDAFVVTMALLNSKYNSSMGVRAGDLFSNNIQSLDKSALKSACKQGSPQMCYALAELYGFSSDYYKDIVK